MLIQRYLSLSQISRRSLQNLYLHYGVYTCSEVPVGITEITKRILILQNLFLYGSTCKYYKTYTGTSYLILELRSISLCYRYYTCISDLIRVLQNLYLSYGTYIGLRELILVFRSTYWYFGTYTCITELIHVFQILYMYITEIILVLRNLYWSYVTDPLPSDRKSAGNSTVTSQPSSLD